MSRLKGRIKLHPYSVLTTSVSWDALGIETPIHNHLPGVHIEVDQFNLLQSQLLAELERLGLDTGLEKDVFVVGKSLSTGCIKILIYPYPVESKTINGEVLPFLPGVLTELNDGSNYTVVQQEKRDLSILSLLNGFDEPVVLVKTRVIILTHSDIFYKEVSTMKDITLEHNQ